MSAPASPGGRSAEGGRGAPGGEAPGGGPGSRKPGQPPGRVRARAVVSGRVQGVCFRAETRSEAERLGVTGWVRNRSDGNVEVLAEGSRRDVERLLEWCRKGPAYARVDGVDVTWEEAAGDFTRFAISR